MAEFIRFREVWIRHKNLFMLFIRSKW